ncbi:hypothetical protein TPSD3_03350 [Thioflexithrix psekupsensis]|uniref:Uncharacterized protein n=2 Tax=Thioflexithrix psekupsensis TaxID=1570016 RepID=A0A251XBV7_9GAMM|nr:hypothetical protein TPSD3_03350 [Thioflexithrix psekupsensis]
MINPNSSQSESDRFDPQVHLSFSLHFHEREQLKQLAITRGCSVEELLQQQVRQLLDQQAQMKK